jgi:hypothetical protein
MSESNGNIGIGTGSPTSRLEIAAQDGLAISGFQPFLTFRDTSTNARALIASGGGDTSFYPETFIGGVAAMTIKDLSGNVGIGTTSPTSRLEIAAQDGLAISGFQPFLTLRDTSTNTRALIASGGGDTSFYPETFIGGGAAMTIKDLSGNVGIGTTTPASKLTVVDNPKFSNQWAMQVLALDPQSMGLFVRGRLAVLGRKSGAVELDKGRGVLLYALETPAPMFEDVGTARLDHGMATIAFDPMFARTVNTTDEDYFVFLTPKGPTAGLYVTNEAPTSFEVRALDGSDIAFNWRVVAKQKGSENIRMEQIDIPAEANKHEAMHTH